MLTSTLCFGNITLVRGSVGIGRRARLRILWYSYRVSSSLIFRSMGAVLNFRTVFLFLSQSHLFILIQKVLAFNPLILYNLCWLCDEGILCPWPQRRDSIIEGRRIYYEGSFFCETDVREVQGYQEKRKNHDYLREPEAQAETGLSRSKAVCTYRTVRWQYTMR